ncbi:MAG: DNA repair exonuclease [Saprospirales bacterium]|nr:MAG: DNA repair exonuclease [Saprospirales bacterium]
MHIKFIHAADLHLGSPFRGLSRINSALSEKMIQANFVAFDRLIDAALSERVDFVLIAGDSFDTGSGTMRAQYYFNRGMKRLEEKGIMVYLITGNHDPINTWSNSLKLPQNVHLFSGEEPERVHFKKNGKDAVALFGMSYAQREEKRNLALMYPQADRLLLSIALLHGDFGTDSGHMPYSPFSMMDLETRQMDYWALGHIHKRAVLSRAKPTVAFSGNIQGRHFNEEGDKGCFLVEFNGKTLQKMHFRPLSPIVYKRIEMDCTGIEDLDSFSVKLDKLIETIRDEYPERGLFVLPTLKGSTELYRAFQDGDQLMELFNSFNAEYLELNPLLQFESPINKTLPNIDLDERKKADDFFADLLREFDQLASDPSRGEKLIEETDEEINRRHRKYIRDLHEEFLKEPELNEIIRDAGAFAVNAIMMNKLGDNDY